MLNAVNNFGTVTLLSSPYKTNGVKCTPEAALSSSPEAAKHDPVPFWGPGGGVGCAGHFFSSRKTQDRGLNGKQAAGVRPLL